MPEDDRVTYGRSGGLLNRGVLSPCPKKPGSINVDLHNWHIPKIVYSPIVPCQSPAKYWGRSVDGDAHCELTFPSHTPRSTTAQPLEYCKCTAFRAIKQYSGYRHLGIRVEKKYHHVTLFRAPSWSVLAGTHCELTLRDRAHVSRTWSTTATAQPQPDILYFT